LSSAHVERRLAAILAADVAGFCRLIGIDEEGTLARLKAVRKGIVDPTIASHRGRIVKTTGDGMLVEFASAVDAVRSAVQVQLNVAEQDASVPQDQRIEFRIGIHVGDIIFDDNDIFGDGVNIAARLEGIAEPGGVCMSDDTYRQIRGKVEIACDDLGPQALKNIAEPMRAWRVRLGGQSAATAQPGSATGQAPALAFPDGPSIAVLPFQNMSGDPEQEYFADGTVEEIITALSRFQHLFVIARNSSFTYKGRAVDVKQVGRELGVRYVMEGSVRKAGNRVRINGQLIDTATGAHLWADRFEGGLEDIFELQDQVTASVVSAIGAKLEKVEIERAKRKPTGCLDAYDYYLRGMASFYRWTKEDVSEALRLSYKAIEIDPEFSSAYGLAAWCYFFRMVNGWTTDRVQEAAETTRLARHVAELGNDDAVALSFSGVALGYVAEDVEGGVVLSDRALVLNPNLATAWIASATLRAFLGDANMAAEHAARAMRLSPLDPLMFLIDTIAALAHFLAGRYGEAWPLAERACRERPHFLGAVRVAAATNALAGRLNEARGFIAWALQLDPELRISNLKNRVTWFRPEDFAKYAEALRRAGLPE
jgi:TolB-like protein/class 3 adenylate cyclase/tetratricopeptide (TPR) repeat protein